ncbi:MAG: DUF1844 domain-containing protein [Elusimicrobia bacterium]|nr:DUF1844 domain-containing protein [Elusimicrobiota bacterium]
MSEDKTIIDQIDPHFFNLIMSLSQTALFGMGKISHPQTGEIEKDMELARVNIDIIHMFKEKTKGNLTEKEKEIITDTLMNLQLTFADEKKRDDLEKSKETEESKDKSEDSEESKEDINQENSETEENSEK